MTTQSLLNAVTMLDLISRGEIESIRPSKIGDVKITMTDGQIYVYKEQVRKLMRLDDWRMWTTKDLI